MKLPHRSTNAITKPQMCEWELLTVFIKNSVFQMKEHLPIWTRRTTENVQAQQHGLKHFCAAKVCSPWTWYQAGWLWAGFVPPALSSLAFRGLCPENFTTHKTPDFIHIVQITKTSVLSQKVLCQLVSASHSTSLRDFVSKLTVVKLMLRTSKSPQRDCHYCAPKNLSFPKSTVLSLVQTSQASTIRFPSPNQNFQDSSAKFA